MHKEHLTGFQEGWGRYSIRGRDSTIWRHEYLSYPGTARLVDSLTKPHYSAGLLCSRTGLRTNERGPPKRKGRGEAVPKFWRIPGDC